MDNKTTEQLKEELRKRNVAAHQLWLENPTTQLFIQWLSKRSLEYDNKLCDHVRKASDKEFEDKCRSAITTCYVIMHTASDSDEFVNQTTKQ